MERKKASKKKGSKGGGMSQMMMMMAMADQFSAPKTDPLEEQLLEMIQKQNQALESMMASKGTKTRDLLDRIHKLEMALEEEEDDDARNPVMDLFFLQNMMTSQAAVNN